MQITEELKAKAEQGFEKQLRKSIDWVSDKCWVFNLENRLNDINELIKAGRQLEIHDAETMTEDEIKQLVADFTPLRTLEMNSEVRARLIEVLISKGINKSLFEPVPAATAS